MTSNLEGSHLEDSQLEQFIATVARLRGPDGCPWDREQTHKSLARFLLEEAYEVMEAIHEGDCEKIKDELGDLLLQIVLNAQVAQDDGKFTIEDVAANINAKMIRRHPHVFADAKVNDADGVVAQWQELKEQEKKDRQEKDVDGSALAGVPKTMPALMQALKISEKAVRQGFEWEKEGDVWDKLHSEIAELQEAVSHPHLTSPQSQQSAIPGDEEAQAAAREAMALEFGDMLFCMVNLARWHALDPEECLLMTINKFKKRFEWMEKNAQKPLKAQSPEELNHLWEGAKTALKSE